jgi:excinuclease ABC subunit B
MYADTITGSMQRAIEETDRRRKIQLEYNEKHGIKPETIKKQIRTGIETKLKARKVAQEAVHMSESEYDAAELAVQIEKEMLEAAQALDFERAAQLRDQLAELKEMPVIKKAR